MLPGLGGVTCGKVVKKTLTLHKLNQYPLPVAFFHKVSNMFRNLNILFTNLLLHAAPFSWKLYFGGKLKVDFAEDLHRQM